MKRDLEKLNTQIADAITIGKTYRYPKPKKISKILFCAMGGSAIGGDILERLVGRTSKLFFKVNRSNELPLWVDSETLVIISSYSGNTKEIVSIFPALRKSKAVILSLCSGGELESLSEKNKAMLVKIPNGMMPRCAIGYTTFTLMPLLKSWGILKYSEKEIQEVLQQVKNVSRLQAKILAGKLHHRYVHFYGAAHSMAPALTRWRAQWAENAKSLSSQHFLPEIFHNEIEGWRFPADILKQSAAVFFKDREDPKALGSKTRAAQKVIEKSGAMVLEIESQGKFFLARLFSLIALGDWISFELALLNGVDPLAIPTIEAIKKIK